MKLVRLKIHSMTYNVIQIANKNEYQFQSMENGEGCSVHPKKNRRHVPVKMCLLFSSQPNFREIFKNILHKTTDDNPDFMFSIQEV